MSDQPAVQPPVEELDPLEETVLTYTIEPYRYTKSKIAKLIKRSESTVWRIQQDLVRKGKLDKTPSGHIFKGKYEHATKVYEEIENKTFKETPSVKKWIESMRSRSIVDYKRRVTNLWKLCKTIDKSPEELLENINIVQTYWDQFVNKFRGGEAFSIRQDGNKTGGLNPKHYGDALKSFREANGRKTEKGYIETEQTNSGIYARVRLSDREKKLGADYIKSKYGEEMYRIFILDNEMGFRSNTLFFIRPLFERHVTTIDGVECEYFKCLVMEEKQKAPYEKPIITPEAREIARNLQNGKTIHNSTNISQIKAEYNAVLRDVFAYLGKISQNKEDWKSYRVGTQEWYYVHDPTHAIRHSCVHWLMRITGMRATVVSSFFWETPETLDIYAKTTLEEILEQHVCNYCNPPKNPDPNYLRFCTLSHALVYYNTGKIRAELVN